MAAEEAAAEEALARADGPAQPMPWSDAAADAAGWGRLVEDALSHNPSCSGVRGALAPIKVTQSTRCEEKFLEL